MILVRLILIVLIVYLLVKGFMRSLVPDDTYEHDNENHRFRQKEAKPVKRVSKSIGEYVDYEEKEKSDSGGS